MSTDPTGTPPPGSPPPPPPPPPQDWAPAPDAPAGPDEPAWQRLDPRMLLVHPITELVKFLPVLIGLLVAGGASGTGPWALLGVGFPVGFGVLRYLTTTYRVTPARVELRRGLLHRHTLSTPVDRVRTVDLTASPIHRVLGLATTVIGTGSVATGEDDRLLLDALPREQAAALRGRLLSVATGEPGPDGAAGTTDVVPERVVARFSPRWLWYAPFSSAVLVATGAVLGTAAPLLESVELRIDEEDLDFFSPALGAALAAGALVLVAALAVAGYLVLNGGFTLTRQESTWHVARGLLTHRETSIDVVRLAGVSIAEPAALRLARGRRLTAIVTGLTGSQQASTVLLPPAPRDTVVAAAASVLGAPEPASGLLRSHGRAATTRRFTRALIGSLPLVAAVVVAVAAGAPAGLLVLAALVVLVALALAADRARSLGHAHLAGHVVARSGSLLRRRAALADEHVIGWNLRATWFQRRAGLVTVAATTAGGDGQVRALDVPEDDALALAQAATPGLLDEFLEER
ncbi:PH domain-containing protein [Nocardioides sp. J54]|nr:PH domain-containing protein [Nocardioides sp. J54]